MRDNIKGFLATTILVSIAAATSGCGRSGPEVLPYDAKLSEVKSAEYKKEMEEAMKNRAKGPSRQHSGRPNR